VIVVRFKTTHTEFIWKYHTVDAHRRTPSEYPVTPPKYQKYSAQKYVLRVNASERNKRAYQWRKPYRAK
jgi:hypothetical protein